MAAGERRRRRLRRTGRVPFDEVPPGEDQAAVDGPVETSQLTEGEPSSRPIEPDPIAADLIAAAQDDPPSPTEPPRT
jgi:hypothetical protein